MFVAAVSHEIWRNRICAVQRNIAHRIGHDMNGHRRVDAAGVVIVECRERDGVISRRTPTMRNGKLICRERAITKIPPTRARAAKNRSDETGRESGDKADVIRPDVRSEEHTSELQSLR